MHDDSKRRVDGQRHAVHQAVRHLDRMNRKRPNAEALSRLDFPQVGVLQQPMLFQLVFDISQREFRTPNRHVQFGKHPREGTDVVFVSVGENNGANLRAIFNQVGDVRHNDVHPQQLGFGEHQPGIDHDNVILPAHGHAVHSELA